MAWHPSGNFLLTTSLDSTLKIWDVREGQLFYTLHGHEGAVYDCCFSPAGDFFASAGCDEQVPHFLQFNAAVVTVLLTRHLKPALAVGVH